MNGLLESAANVEEKKKSTIASRIVFVNNIFFVFIMVVFFVVLTPIYIKLKMVGDKSLSAMFLMAGMLSYPLSLAFVHVGSKKLLEKEKGLTAIAIWMIPAILAAIAIIGYFTNPNFFHPF